MPAKSASPQTPKTLVDDLLSQLDEEKIQEMIDTPIEEACNEFPFNLVESMTHGAFLQIIGEFVSHIYSRVPIPWPFPSNDARAEAIMLLERYDERTSANGYEAAYLNAFNQSQGAIALVLRHMADAIKTSQRSKYIHYLFSSHIALREWRIKVEIATYLQEHWQEYLPQQILDCPPEVLANDLPDFIQTYLYAETMISNTASGASNFMKS